MIFNKMKYNPQKIEKRWQKIWEKTGIYKVPDKLKGKKNLYCSDMFPYPSGEGIHVGHLHGYIGSDVVARYYRMKGFNVLHPMGFDAFGLPAENAAIKRKIHPKTWTYKNIKTIRKQLKSLGAVYDWSREVITCDPEYYKWTQWLFLQFYKKGLAYKAKIPANFCPSCKTILANEQVIGGRCERCKSFVFQKPIDQWLFKITDYAEDLLKDLEDLDWPEETKMMQRNWIGKSEGWEIKFKIKDEKTEIPVFTTRIDTLFGATYLVLAPENKIVEDLKPKIENLKFVQKYIEETKKKTELERISEVREKTGIELKGIKAINPANNREIPVFVADYVLIHYGTGAIMGVPAHDKRDLEFARRFNLPIIEVIKSRERILPKKASLITADKMEEGAYEGEGILINSGRFDGLDSEKAKERIGEWLAKKGMTKKAVYYKLRDWIISRQRYWGCPIPMIFCQKCGWQPVKEKDLPVLLPKIKSYLPSIEGKSPLANSKKFLRTSCPKCKGEAIRETDTMDTFICSSWYFLRYSDPKNKNKFASKRKLKAWLPVDIYVGGAEHAVSHLLYSRFFVKALKDMGHLDFKEPFLKLRHQGVIMGPDGKKMSKSRGNVIVPETVSKKYGMDALRLYEMFMGPFEKSAPWDPKGIEGCFRFLKKVWDLRKKIKEISPEKELEKKLHQTIKKVTKDIENFQFNTAVSSLMIFGNEMKKRKEIARSQFERFLLLLAPFVPHIIEEIWQKEILKNPNPKFTIKNSVHNQSWPSYDEKLIRKEKINLVVEINGKVRDKIEVEADISEKEAKELAVSREKIKKWIEGKKIKKFIFVPGKLINIVLE